VENRKGDLSSVKSLQKVQTDPTPDRNLTSCNFWLTKLGDCEDASFEASPSLNGVVIETRLFSKT